MSKVKFELNTKGVGQLLKSDEMKAVLESAANTVASRAGGGYEVKTIKAQTRVIATVAAADKETRRDNLKNNTLLKALGGG